MMEKHYKIVDIGKDDAYYEDRESLIGLLCEKSRPEEVPYWPLEAFDDNWYTGSLLCEDDNIRMFHSIKLEEVEE